MERWPAVDRAVRRELLDRLRRRQNVEASRLPPQARLSRLDDMLALVRAFRRSAGGVRRASASDEPVELLLRMKARFRRSDERG